MSVKIPEDLRHLESNCGVFAVWMILQHYGVNMDIEQLKHACKYDHDDGTFSIGLAVALQKFGFSVTFHSDEDLNQHDKEEASYAEAQVLGLPLLEALNYQDLTRTVALGNFVIVFYDTLAGVGNHSLIYTIDEKEICFFDNFAAMPADVFEQQRNAEGICRQAIVIDRHNFQQRYC